MGGGAFQPVQDQLDHHSTRLDSSPLGIKLEASSPKNEWLGCLDSSSRDASVPSGRFDGSKEMGEGFLHYRVCRRFRESDVAYLAREDEH